MFTLATIGWFSFAVISIYLGFKVAARIEESEGVGNNDLPMMGCMATILVPSLFAILVGLAIQYDVSGQVVSAERLFAASGLVILTLLSLGGMAYLVYYIRSRQLISGEDRSDAKGWLPVIVLAFVNVIAFLSSVLQIISFYIDFGPK